MNAPTSHEVRTLIRWRRAHYMFGVAPSRAVEVLDHIRLHRCGKSSGFMRYEPPRGAAQFRLATPPPPHAYATVRRA